VLDLALPDMDGTELILKLRSEKNYADMAFIALTGVAVSAARAEVLSSFAVPMMTKPWDEAALVERIASVFMSGGPADKPALPTRSPTGAR
jgi:DNA-binding response OmpR family regulator